MTSKSGFFVFILIASGCLSKACGEGQISASPRSSEGAPTPDQPNVDEPTPDQSDVARPAGPLGDPYVHVTPADIGVTIGPGVIAPYPTEVYTGPCQITTPNTTIENKIINCDVLKPDADNITIRNSVLNLSSTGDGANGIRLGPTNSTANGFKIEYSHLKYPNPNGKILNAWNAGPYQDFIIRNSHIEGGYDMFFMEGDLDGMIIENNVLGPLACQNDDSHADGFQFGNTGDRRISGTQIIRGNYIQHLTNCSKTALWFLGHGTSNAIIESNRIPIWGSRTLWASDEDSMQVRYNVYSSEFQAAVGNRCGCGSYTPGQPACCSYPNAAAVYNVTGGPSSSAVCNRYEDGSFVEQAFITCKDGSQCVTHVTTGCPDYP